ncbi:MAG: DUF3307 domain-containing protein [Candidatus Zixiibacteriota bacterium]
MSLFWRLLAAHFLIDFTLQTGWFLRNKDKAYAIALHSFLFVIAGIFFVYPLLLADATIVVTVLGLGIWHFIVDFIKSQIAREKGSDLYLFLADQFIHIFSIWMINLLLYYHKFPLESKYYPSIAMAIFAIWGVPILIFLIKKKFIEKQTIKHNYVHREKANTLSMVERAGIYIAIVLGNWFFLGLLLAIIIRIYLFTSSKEKKFPIANWGLAGFLALAIRFVRV